MSDLQLVVMWVSFALLIIHEAIQAALLNNKIAEAKAEILAELRRDAKEGRE